MSFADRVSAAVVERQSQVVLGLDPDPARLLPAPAGRGRGGSPAERSAAAVAGHCRALIEAAGPACVAIKLQLACFERLGWPGWRALENVVAAGREAGLLVIADAKRGDVPHTAAVYGQALVGGPLATPFGEVPGLGADALTANPLLGRDSLEPIVEAARERGGGVFVLVRTSNPGAAAIQDEPESDPLRRRLAVMVDELGAGGVGECGLSDIGAVVGATEPGLLAGLRELMPRALFLLPGVGAQGGRVEDLAPAFSPGAAAGLVTASRSIVDAALAAGDASAAREVAERLRDSAWQLS